MLRNDVAHETVCFGYVTHAVQTLTRPKLLTEAHDELPRVPALEQHAEADGRLLQPLQHVLPLAEAPVPSPRRGPGAGFVVTFAVVEHQETLHASMRRRQPSEIAQTV